MIAAPTSAPTVARVDPNDPVALPAAGPLLELRQYKITAGERDRFIDLFDQTFVETQDAAGMPLIGQFRELRDPDRFVWLRAFDTMRQRRRALEAFYSSSVWQDNRDAANALLDDNDNVLLLRPADPASALATPATRPGRAAMDTASSAPLIVVTIHYLWKPPQDGFAAFFRSRMAPLLETAGLPVLGAYVIETARNTFPRLPVREGEKVFVWFTRAASESAFAEGMQMAMHALQWSGAVAGLLASFEERPAQTLYLAATGRSALR